ncbi:MAG: 16S rRNA (cytosine(1402)-N(4))-methyltransferase, partial [Betaproteobacteria bacterium HGW-Betaproteobacteria-8]
MACPARARDVRRRDVATHRAGGFFAVSVGQRQPPKPSASLSPESPPQVTDLNTNTHITVLLNEAVDALAIKPSGVYVDATFGRGGHSRKILEKLGDKGRLIALDRDLAAIAAAAEIRDARFQIIHSHFSAIKQALADAGVQQVDGILLDIGISSPQIDEGERGFSFRFDGPLDMRMDQSRGQTAAEFIAGATEQQLTGVIKDYGEERFAKQIARAIVATRTGGGAITTTG